MYTGGVQLRVFRLSLTPPNSNNSTILIGRSGTATDVSRRMGARALSDGACDLFSTAQETNVWSTVPIQTTFGSLSTKLLETFN